MNTTGCESGKATDMVLIAREDASQCSSDFLSVAIFASFIAAGRIILSVAQLIVTIQTNRKKKRARKGNNANQSTMAITEGGEDGEGREGRGGISLASCMYKSPMRCVKRTRKFFRKYVCTCTRLPLTFLSETFATITTVLFVSLALMNKVNSEDGLALVVYGLIFFFYCITALLAVLKLINVSSKSVMKATVPKDDEMKRRQSQNQSGSQSHPDGQNELRIRKISDINSNLAMKVLFTLIVLGIASTPTVLIVGLVLDFEPSIEVFVQAVFYSGFVPCFLLCILFFYHSFITFRLVQASLTFGKKQGSDRRGSSNAAPGTDSKRMRRMERLIRVLKIRLVSAVVFLALPIVILLQGLRVIPITMPYLMINPFFTLMGTFIGILVFQPICASCRLCSFMNPMKLSSSHQARNSQVGREGRGSLGKQEQSSTNQTSHNNKDKRPSVLASAPPPLPEEGQKRDSIPGAASS